jgi:hypothetical protein
MVIGSAARLQGVLQDAVRQEMVGAAAAAICGRYACRRCGSLRDRRSSRRRPGLAWPAPGPDLPAWRSFPAREAHLEALVSLPDGSDDYMDLDRTVDMTSTKQARCVLDDRMKRRRLVDHQFLGWPSLVQGSMAWGCQKNSDFHRYRRAHDAPRATGRRGLGPARSRASGCGLAAAAPVGHRPRDGVGLGRRRCPLFPASAADLAAGRFERTWTVMQTS